MKLAVDQKAIVNAMAKLVTLTEKRSPLPILSYCLVVAENDTITLSATDLEMGVNISIPCKVDETGQTTLPAKKFFEIVRQLPDSDIILSADSKWRATVSAGFNTSFNIAGFDPADYPQALTSSEDSPTTVITKDHILNLIDRSVFAASNDSSRSNLNAVLLECKDSSITAVATDGHRLGLSTENVTISEDGRFLIDKKNMISLRKIIGSIKEEQLEFGVDVKNLVFRTPNMSVRIRFMDGDFPDYTKVIPRDVTAIIKVNKQSLLDTVKRVHTLASEKFGRIGVSIVNNNLKCSIDNPDIGKGEDNMDVDYFSTNEISFLVNSDYMLQAIAAIDTDSLLIEYTKENAPIRLKPIEGDYFNLIMPMRKL